MIGTTISHYKILEKLGGGGMGVVYKAQDTRLMRTVALKFLPPDLTRDEEAKTRFVHEAQAASALQHNNICNIHDIEETEDGQTFIVMDCYEGDTLKSRIAKGELRIDDAIDIAIQVAQGLSEAHAHGIVHRDIKPANIMVTTRGDVKVLDFGLAKLAGQTMLTKSGSTIGTAAYMSPEQARGEKVDHRTDIWSLGVVLYEMLAGKRPFESEYDQGLVYCIVNQEPVPLKELCPEIPDALDTVVQRAMAKNDDERYQSASEFLADLEACQSGKDISRQTREAPARKRRLAYGAAVVAVLLAGAAIIYTSSRGEVFDSIGVLAFENLSGDTTRAFFARGLTDAVIERLWQVSSLRVPSLNTISAKVKPGMTYGEMAKVLGVKAILKARVEQDGNRLRITASLMDPREDKPMWTQSFDREYSSVLTLQSDLAQAILQNVRVTLTSAERAQLNKAQQKVDPHAYELYLKARARIRTYASEEEWKQLVEMAQQAINLDSTYAPFHALKASLILFGCGDGFLSSNAGIAKAEAEIREALGLDSDDPISRKALADIRVAQWRFKEAGEAYESALKLNPGNADVLFTYSDFLMRMAQFERSIDLTKRALAIDPTLDPDGLELGIKYYYAKRYDEAIAEGRKACAKSPNSVWVHNLCSIWYGAKGMKQEALDEMEKSIALGTPEESSGLMLNNAGTYAMLGMVDKALETLHRYLAVRKGKPLNVSWVAFAFAALGKDKEAFEWLERAYEEHNVRLTDLKVENSWDRYRSDPRFVAMLKKVGFEQ